jgi:hypothetical protein
MKNIKLVFVVVAALAFVVPARGQLLISDFSSINPVTAFDLGLLVGGGNDSWLGNIATTTYGQVVGGTANHGGGAKSPNFGTLSSPLNVSGYSGLSLRAVRGGLEAGSSYYVWLVDNDADAFRFDFPTGSFGTASLTTVTVGFGSASQFALSGTSDGIFDTTRLSQFLITGSGGGAQVNVGFDSLSAVPEPRAYAAVAGFLLIGFAAYRRLKTA